MQLYQVYFSNKILFIMLLEHFEAKKCVILDVLMSLSLVYL